MPVWGTRGYDARLASGWLSGARQQETQCSKLSQQLSSLPHLCVFLGGRKREKGEDRTRGGGEGGEQAHGVWVGAQG